MNGFVDDGMSTEVDSLQRRVKFLSRALAVAQREHREELAVKETALFSGISKREKLQKLNVQLKASKSELEASVKAHATTASAAEAEILTLNTENKRLCSVAKRMKARISELEAEKRRALMREQREKELVLHGECSFTPWIWTGKRVSSLDAETVFNQCLTCLP